VLCFQSRRVSADPTDDAVDQSHCAECLLNAGVAPRDFARIPDELM
jgi:hypothetical protein